jgi:pimeloyl-ACP methyl ester carboxylesterase
MTPFGDRAPASTDALDSMRSSYRGDIARARARLASVPSRRLEAPLATVEYVDDGVGVPIFLSHGVLGGHDNVRDLVDLWLSADYRAIAPSRFGYLGSTMPAGATVADEADVYAALLDHLGLRQVVMVGFSAGGPAAIQFALRHPHRLFGLILGSSYLPGMGAKTVPKALHPLVRAVAGWELGWWLLKRYRPTRLARIMGVPKGWDPSGDEDFLGIREALFPVGPKNYGIAFDALESEPASNDFPLEDIAVPTLLVHAADDRLAPYEFVPAAAARIRGARLVTIPAGGHLFLRHAADTRQATTAFVTDVAAGDAACVGVTNPKGGRP